MKERVGGYPGTTKTTLHAIRIVVMEMTNDPVYSVNLLLPTWTGKYPEEDVRPSGRHQSWIMHPTVLPELGVVAGSLPVDDSCNFRAVDENVVRKEVTVSEVGLCIHRKVTEQPLDVLGPTHFEENTTVVVEVLRGAQKCVWRLPGEGHEPITVGTAGDRPKGLGRERTHLVENDEELISDVVKSGGGHVVDNGVETHAWALLHEEISDAVHPVPGLDDYVEEGGMV